jgi:hypothetical protein
MPTKMLRNTTLIAGCMLGGTIAGCGASANPNLSPTPEQSETRHQQAVRYTLERAVKNQQAEQKAMARMARPSQRP